MQTSFTPIEIAGPTSENQKFSKHLTSTSAYTKAFCSGIDYANKRAFANSPLYLGIRVNIEDPLELRDTINGYIGQKTSTTFKTTLKVKEGCSEKISKCKTDPTEFELCTTSEFRSNFE
jgi:hypothetical protein